VTPTQTLTHSVGVAPGLYPESQAQTGLPDALLQVPCPEQLTPSQTLTQVEAVLPCCQPASHEQTADPVAFEQVP